MHSTSLLSDFYTRIIVKVKMHWVPIEEIASSILYSDSLEEYFIDTRDSRSPKEINEVIKRHKASCHLLKEEDYKLQMIENSQMNLTGNLMFVFTNFILSPFIAQ
jgi:hypothetical protein